MKKYLSLLLMLALCLCMGSAVAEPGSDVLRAVSALTSESFNPLVYGNGDKMVLHSLYDYAFKFNNDGTVTNMLAESFEQDGLVITLKLREDAAFTSGNPVKASDLVFSHDTIVLDPTLAYNMTLWCAEMEAVDDYTVKITLANTYCNWQIFMAELLPVVEEASYDPEANDYTKVAPVGSGAYTLVGQDAAGTVTLVANENYWGGTPAWKNVEIVANMDDDTSVIALQTGEVDLKGMMGLDAYRQAAADENLVAVSFDGWQQYGMMTFVGDQAFRQAVFHGIDREAILEMCNDGNGAASTNIFAEKIMGDYKDAAPFVGFDAELAAECLAQSETDLSQTFTIEVFDADSAAVAQCVQMDLMMLGINVEVAQEDSNVWFDNLMAGTMAFGIAALGTDMMCTEDLITMFDSENGGYPFPCEGELLELLRTAPFTDDDEERVAGITRALELCGEECFWVPLYDSPAYMAHTARVGNVNDCGAATYVYYFGDMTRED